MKKLWGQIHCLFFPHVWGRWVETDLAAIVPRSFIRQCTCCLRMQHGARDPSQVKVRITGSRA